MQLKVHLINYWLHNQRQVVQPGRMLVFLAFMNFKKKTMGNHTVAITLMHILLNRWNQDNQFVCEKSVQFFEVAYGFLKASYTHIHICV